jgi:hypothetical protein
MWLGAILYLIPATWAVLHLAFLAIEVIDYRWELQTNDDPHFPGYDLVYHGPQFVIALYFAAVFVASFGLTGGAAQVVLRLSSVVLGLSSCWIGLALKSRLAAWRGRDWDPERHEKFMKRLERQFGAGPAGREPQALRPPKPSRLARCGPARISASSSTIR